MPKKRASGGQPATWRNLFKEKPSDGESQFTGIGITLPGKPTEFTSG
jgi:hypothetical protein